MSLKEKMATEAVQNAEQAQEMNEQAGTNTSDGLVKLKDDGNVTRQIMNAIGMDSLLTFEDNSKQRNEKE